jgi:6-phosphogluconolactonase (cycloisomerase 2 family)
MLIKRRILVPFTLVLTAAALLAAGSAQARQVGYLSGFDDGDIVAGKLRPDGSFNALSGSPFVTDSSSSQAIVVSADGRRVFLADESDGALRAFKVAKNGSLTEAGGSPQPTGDSAYGVATTPDGKYVYGSADSDDLIAGFKVAGNGSISPTAQGTVTVPDGPHGIVIDRKGKYLFSANGAGSVSAFTIAGSGALTEVPGSPFGSIDAPYALALAPNGKTLYVANRDAPISGVHAFAVNNDGTLVELLGSPWPTAGNNAFSITVSPDGRTVYAGNYDDDSVAGFDVQGSGGLTPQSGNPYMSTESPAALTSNANGSYLFVNSGSTALQAWSVAGDGVPTNPVFDLFGTRGDFQSIALTPAQPPKAKLKAKIKGKKAKLSAKKSKDDGRIIEYAWKFGDGKQTVTMGPKVDHKYKQPGKYKVKVTLTDDDACSTKLITNGQTAYCNGSKQAVATKKAKIKR